MFRLCLSLVLVAPCRGGVYNSHMAVSEKSRNTKTVTSNIGLQTIVFDTHFCKQSEAIKHST